MQKRFCVKKYVGSETFFDHKMSRNVFVHFLTNRNVFVQKNTAKCPEAFLSAFLLNICVVILEGLENFLEMG